MLWLWLSGLAQRSGGANVLTAPLAGEMSRHAAQGVVEQLNTTFSSKADLGIWHNYLESVYGVETMKFPFSLGDLNFFYEDRLPRSIARSLVVRDFGQPASAAWVHNADGPPRLTADADGLGSA
jgi:hypothetical protein